eukprot:TRINITY_DN2832_c0_g1_i3.p1 TRINITY_DN2832_c0_g1~~TRINITY_DN2832_c0_g1_i3.p1  ORF type:complete len:282 (-),score=35.93 TRINITY_DN2832_c0_g1_i3:12-809(-)
MARSADKAKIIHQLNDTLTEKEREITKKNEVIQALKNKNAKAEQVNRSKLESSVKQLITRAYLQLAKDLKPEELYEGSIVLKKLSFTLSSVAISEVGDKALFGSNGATDLSTLAINEFTSYGPPSDRLKAILSKHLLSGKFRRIVLTYLKSPASKNGRKRIEVIREIVESERVYVNSLTVLVEKFIKPLREQVKQGTLGITREDLVDIFSCSERLLKIHDQLQRKLEEGFEVWPVRPFLIGHIFLQQVPSFSFCPDPIPAFLLFS